MCFGDYQINLYLGGVVVKASVLRAGVPMNTERGYVFDSHRLTIYHFNIRACRATIDMPCVPILCKSSLLFAKNKTRTPSRSKMRHTRKHYTIIG